MDSAPHSDSGQRGGFDLESRALSDIRFADVETIHEYWRHFTVSSRVQDRTRGDAAAFDAAPGAGAAFRSRAYDDVYAGSGSRLAGMVDPLLPPQPVSEQPYVERDDDQVDSFIRGAIDRRRENASWRLWNMSRSGAVPAAFTAPDSVPAASSTHAHVPSAAKFGPVGSMSPNSAVQQAYQYATSMMRPLQIENERLRQENRALADEVAHLREQLRRSRWKEEHVNISTDTNLYVKNLPPAIDHEGLRNLFQPYGEIVSSRVMMKRDRHGLMWISKGFGFVCFAYRADAERAAAALHSATINGKVIQVSFHRKRDKDSDAGSSDTEGIENADAPDPESEAAPSASPESHADEGAEPAVSVTASAILEAQGAGSFSIQELAEVCKHWLTKGLCRYGPRCRFKHPEHFRGLLATIQKQR